MKRLEDLHMEKAYNLWKKSSFNRQGVDYTINYNEHFKTPIQYCRSMEKEAIFET